MIIFVNHKKFTNLYIRRKITGLWYVIEKENWKGVCKFQVTHCLQEMILMLSMTL